MCTKHLYKLPRLPESSSKADHSAMEHEGFSMSTQFSVDTSNGLDPTRTRHNLAQLLERSAEIYPERTALVMGETRLSYAEVNAAANQVANLLASHGLGLGDRVLLSMPNIPYFSIAYFGILKTGATVIPLNVLLKSREIAYHLRDSGARGYIAFTGTPELPIGESAQDAVSENPATRLFLVDPGAALPWASQPTSFETAQVGPDETAVILYTSGTTGQPKGAELRHRNMLDNALCAVAMFKSSEDEPDVSLAVLPLFHSFGQTIVQNVGFAHGGTVILMPRFEARAALDLMLKERVTLFAGVPTMFWSLLRVPDEAEDIHVLAEHLRLAISGGAALPGEIHREFNERLGVPILEGYGLSETCPMASISAAYGTEPRVGSVGVPITGVQMKLINDDWSEVASPDAIGEIAIKGHNVMKGYFNRPEATSEAMRDGWFRSGDLARKDADGYYYIVDRAKDLIIRGGFNVYPREIEELLLTHPAVSLAAVIGVPHERHGEEVKAVVVLRSGAKVSEPELIEWIRERVAAYKYPRILEFVDSMPMTTTGKILKQELKSSC